MEELELLEFLDRALCGKEEEDDEDDDDELLTVVGVAAALGRDEKLFRKRWDSEYLMNLATHEGSFIAEYRVDPG